MARPGVLQPDDRWSTPTTPSRNTVYIGGQLSAAKSTDGGAYLAHRHELARAVRPPVCARRPPRRRVHDDRRRPRSLLLGTDGGLFLPATTGARPSSSQKNDGISSYLIYALAGQSQTRGRRADRIAGRRHASARPAAAAPTTRCSAGTGSAWAGARRTISSSLGSIYYSFIIRNVRNPPNTQAKWLVGYDGIAEVFNPAQTLFQHRARDAARLRGSGRLDVLPPHALQAVSHDQRRRRAGRASSSRRRPWRSAPASHPIGVSPADLDHFGVLGNGGNLWFTTDGGTTFNNRVLTVARRALARLQLDARVRRAIRRCTSATKRRSERPCA